MKIFVQKIHQAKIDTLHLCSLQSKAEQLSGVKWVYCCFFFFFSESFSKGEDGYGGLISCLW